jgi:nucleotide-binding universal stress UspA family protein
MSAKILVPLDATTFAEEAMPTAVSLVRRVRGRLELALVYEPIPLGGFSDSPWNASTEAMLDGYLTYKAERVSPLCNTAVGHTLLRGDAAEEICSHARAVQADLIVMASHGRTGLKRALSGSVADAVIRAAGVPVLVLRHVDGAPARPARDFARILIPLDGSPQSREIIEPALTVATDGVTRIILLRVVAPVISVPDLSIPYAYIPGPIDKAATDTLVNEAERDLTRLAEDIAARSGCDVDIHVIVSDHTGVAIADFARKYAADLIAMTTHGRGASRLVMGSVMDVVLGSVSVPLLVLRPTRANAAGAAA